MAPKVPGGLEEKEGAPGEGVRYREAGDTIGKAPILGADPLDSGEGERE
jgi:hypothetical protein